MELLAEPREDAKYRVMVIDDDAMELNLFTRDLSEHFTMSAAQNTDKAWEILNRSPLPDAIILDIIKPDDVGLDFCARLRDSQYTENIPIIFMSEEAESGIKSKAFETGGADFIQKPPSMTELIARVKRHASQYRKTKHLESLIFIDPLTHLPNASKFDDVLKQEWSRCARYWHHISLLLIKVENIAGFKRQHGNDEYYLLTSTIAEQLVGIGSRPGDLLAFLGNDCFGLILSDCSIEGAQLKGQQILERLSASDAIHNQHVTTNSLNYTIAIAVAAPAGGEASDALYKAAKNLLFKSAEDGVYGIVKQNSIIGVDSEL